MMYELMGRTHAALVGLRNERGQGTVEYVGLIKDAIGGVGGTSGGAKS
jgi:hypothetical protein